MKNTTPLRIERLRKKLRLKDVAKAVNIDTGNLSRIERGVQRPSLDLTESLVVFFGNAVSELEILYPDRFSPLNTEDSS